MILSRWIKEKKTMHDFVPFEGHEFNVIICDEDEGKENTMEQLQPGLLVGKRISFFQVLFWNYHLPSLDEVWLTWGSEEEYNVPFFVKLRNLTANELIASRICGSNIYIYIHSATKYSVINDDAFRNLLRFLDRNFAQETTLWQFLKKKTNVFFLIPLGMGTLAILCLFYFCSFK